MGKGHICSSQQPQLGSCLVQVSLCGQSHGAGSKQCIPVTAELHMEGEGALLPATSQAQTALSLVSVSLSAFPYEAGGARQKHAFAPCGA